MSITPMTEAQIEDFIEAYIECALWSTTDENGFSLDDNYSDSDIDDESLKRMEDDCRDFVLNEAWLEALQAGTWTASQGGHDFWLTRNGHGAGFWDRYGNNGSLGYEHGRKLTDLAKIYGGVDLFDDGVKVYCT